MAISIPKKSQQLTRPSGPAGFTPQSGRDATAEGLQNLGAGIADAASTAASAVARNKRFDEARKEKDDYKTSLLMNETFETEKTLAYDRISKETAGLSPAEVSEKWNQWLTETREKVKKDFGASESAYGKFVQLTSPGTIKSHAQLVGQAQEYEKRSVMTGIIKGVDFHAARDISADMDLNQFSEAARTISSGWINDTVEKGFGSIFYGIDQKTGEAMTPELFAERLDASMARKWIGDKISQSPQGAVEYLKANEGELDARFGEGFTGEMLKAARQENTARKVEADENYKIFADNALSDFDERISTGDISVETELRNDPVFRDLRSPDQQRSLAFFKAKQAELKKEDKAGKKMEIGDSGAFYVEAFRGVMTEPGRWGADRLAQEFIDGRLNGKEFDKLTTELKERTSTIMKSPGTNEVFDEINAKLKKGRIGPRDAIRLQENFKEWRLSNPDADPAGYVEKVFLPLENRGVRKAKEAAEGVELVEDIQTRWEALDFYSQHTDIADPSESQIRFFADIDKKAGDFLYTHAKIISPPSVQEEEGKVLYEPAPGRKEKDEILALYYEAVKELSPQWRGRVPEAIVWERVREKTGRERTRDLPETGIIGTIRGLFK